MAELLGGDQAAGRVTGNIKTNGWVSGASGLVVVGGRERSRRKIIREGRGVCASSSLNDVAPFRSAMLSRSSNSAEMGDGLGEQPARLVWQAGAM